jgi:hypothetical protein
MKANAPPAVGVCTKKKLLQKLRLRMTMETSLTSRSRPAKLATLLARDAPVQENLNAKVAQKASSSERVNVLLVVDVNLVKSKWTLLMQSASRTMVPSAKSARPVLTQNATDARTPPPENVCSARKVTPDPTLDPVPSAPRDVLSARTLLLV